MKKLNTDLCNIPTSPAFYPISYPDDPFPRSEIGGADLVFNGQMSTDAQRLASSLIGYAREMGYSFVFTSGYRSPEYQRELQRRWDAGNRAGLVARPADSSSHTRGNAFDISASPDVLKALGAEAMRLGARWGGVWIPPDPVHFDVEKRG